MRKVILDLDTGIDDAMALAYTVGCGEMELLGVTCTFGNVYTPHGVENVLRLLRLLKREDVPVFPGAEKAMEKPTFVREAVSARIHGENGVGQVLLPPTQGKAQSEDAVSFLKRSIREHQKALTIVTTGPLTNLALAFRRAPALAEQVGAVIVMGGALTVEGNVSECAEANISQDPEAARLVFESGADITLVGLDVTQRSQLTKEDTALWRSCGTEAGRLYGDMVDYYIDQHSHSGGTACYLHDPSAAVCALHPEFFQTLPLHLTVKTAGPTVGRTVADSTKLRLPEPKTAVCVGVLAKEVERELMGTLLKLFRA